MIIEHWWNDTYRRKPKYSEKTLSLDYFVLRKSPVEWHGIEPDSAVKGRQLTA
jgi:hypothetical protein